MARRRWIRRPPEWGVDPLPPQRRQLRTLDVSILWFSLGVGLLVLVAGTILVAGFGLSLAEVIVVSVAGSILGAILLAVAALPGTDHGVPTMVSLRPVLGVRGSYVPTALNVVTLMGWAAFELLIMGLVGATLTGLSPLLLIPLFGIVVGLLALGGPVAVVRHWLERFAIWLVVGSTIWIIAQLAVRPIDWSAEIGFGSSSAAMLLALDLVVVLPVSWWPLVADYNRFARRRRDGTAGTLIGYSIANTVFFALGAALQIVAIQQGYADFVVAIAALNLGLLALVFILVDETDNAFANVYSTAVSMQNVFPRQRQFRFVVVATAAAVGIAVALQFTYPTPALALGSGYESFLFLIGGLFVPLLGVLAADHFAVRRGAYRSEEFSGAGPSVRPAAFIAWVPAALLYFAIVGPWSSWFPPTGATLPSFAAAAAIYLATTWVASRTRTSAAVP